MTPTTLPGSPRITESNVWTNVQKLDLWGIWQDIARAFNLTRASTGVTGTITSGSAVNHSLGQVPSFVLVTAQDSGPTNIYVSGITSTQFVINFGGGGSHVFGWRAEQ